MDIGNILSDKLGISLDQLAGMLANEVGITEEQAEKSIEFLFNQIKDRIPEQYKPFVDNFLGEDEEDAAEGGANFDLGDAASLLGGLFGKKK